ncbi:Extracellular calcium-sensing receptor [Tupaia chinensis]|uniref:Extracellular calcium-sensing receptor n=1 Tax=Tupaia chinensis TaxID=246437 RepID=L9KUL6_TUPCH|nr:Extracellular calcium-sensing receptor [Tupaia chinensis]
MTVVCLWGRCRVSARLSLPLSARRVLPCAVASPLCRRGRRGAAPFGREDADAGLGPRTLRVSYSSTAVSLSDKIEFPSFLRTISSDQSWAQGVALLLRYFNWTWVGIVTQDDDFGIQGSSLLITELEKIGACKEFFITISISKSSEKIQHEYKKQLRTSTSKVIVMFLNSMSFPHIYEGLSVSDIRGKIWIRSNVQENEVQQSNLGMSQTISILRSKVIIPGFSEFLNQMHPSRNEENVFIKTFWEENFDCKWPGQGLGPQGNSTDTGEVKFCTKVEHLQGQFMSALIETYNTYTAVYSIAYALQDLSSQDDGRRPFKSKTYAKERDIQPWQILLYLKNVHFKAPNGKRVTFNANGDFFERYDILNWQETPRGSFHSVKIGYIDPMASTGEELMINKSTLIWRGGASQVPLSVCSESCPPGFNQIPSSNRPHCCFDCSLCPEGQYSDIRDAEQCIECPEDQYPNKERNDCLPKTEIFLSFEEPLGMTLTCFSLAAQILFLREDKAMEAMFLTASWQFSLAAQILFLREDKAMEAMFLTASWQVSCGSSSASSL